MMCLSACAYALNAFYLLLLQTGSLMKCLILCFSNCFSFILEIIHLKSALLIISCTGAVVEAEVSSSLGCVWLHNSEIAGTQ